jgi:hypothetical protein
VEQGGEVHQLAQFRILFDSKRRLDEGVGVVSLVRCVEDLETPGTNSK